MTVDHPTAVALERVIAQANRILLGKEATVQLALTCLLARGHLLIEDVPGVGKTTLAQALALTLGLTFHRIQFTSDMLPADILGVSVYQRDEGSFKFHAGPIFAQVVLADEVNRATPKAQSALLEAMEERQVTVEGETRILPTPFFVLATQNPSYQIGTFPLPESQLDRFLMRLQIGYPDPRAERELLKGKDRRVLLADLGPALERHELLAIQDRADAIHASDAMIEYVQALLDFSRHSGYFQGGLSPRAGLALMRSARAWALLQGRPHVAPDDAQAVLASVVGHRLRPAAPDREMSSEEIAALFLEHVPVP